MRNRTEPLRVGTRGRSMAPFETYECLDGPLAVIAYQKKHWQRLCSILERPDLVGNDRFRSSPRRMKNVLALKKELELTLRTKPRDHWAALLLEADIACGKVNTFGEVLDDAQVCVLSFFCNGIPPMSLPPIKTTIVTFVKLQHRNMLPRTTDKQGKTFVVIGNPIKLSGYPDPDKLRPPPAVDEQGPIIRSKL